VTRKYVDAVPSTEAFQRAVAPGLQVELPTASVAASNLDPAVGGGGVLEDRSGYDCGGGCMKPRLCGGQQPVEGGGGHVEGPPAVGDPSHNIIGD
jgi:hypothetical protein